MRCFIANEGVTYLVNLLYLLWGDIGRQRWESGLHSRRRLHRSHSRGKDRAAGIAIIEAQFACGRIIFGFGTK